MDDYVERMINEFPMKISKSDMNLTPYGNNLFDHITEKVWVKKETEEFHNSVAR